MKVRAVLPSVVLGAALVLTVLAVGRSSCNAPEPEAESSPAAELLPPGSPGPGASSVTDAPEGTDAATGAKAPDESGAPDATDAPGDTDAEGTDATDVASDEDAVTAPLQRMNVQIYYPASSDDGLLGEPHEIFLTAAPGDQAKQIVADLISGPTSEDAIRAVPPGTQLRQIFVLDNGTAWADFSADLRQGIGGGSTEELLTVYSIVNSVALNVSEIRKLGILINGRPVETLNGHMDLRRPLPPDRTLILGTTKPLVVRAGRPGERPVR